MTNREARTRLASLRESTHTTLQAHAMEVNRLVQLAYEGQPDAQKLEKAVELFCSTIGNTSLQQHLLAVHMPDLESAVRAGNDYLWIRPPSTPTHIKAILPEKLEPEAVNQLGSNHTTPPIEQLLKLIQGLTQEVQQLRSRMSQQGQRRAKAPSACFKCGQEGH